MKALADFGPWVTIARHACLAGEGAPLRDSGRSRIAHVWTRQVHTRMEEDPRLNLAGAGAKAADHPGARPVADPGAESSDRSSSGRRSTTISAAGEASRVAG